MPKSKKTQPANYKREGIKLLRYLKQDSFDLPATAHQIQGKHYTVVGEDLFYRRSLQKEQANAARRAKQYRANFPSHSCEEIGLLVLESLESTGEKRELALDVKAPVELLDAFEEACRTANLLDHQGRFSDSKAILRFLCDCV
jgi:hypothetical protein